MAAINFNTVYRWDAQTQAYLAYSPGTTTDLSVSTLFKFAGPITGEPIKFLFYPTNSASTTIYLSTGITASFPTEVQSFSFAFTANTWNEVTFNSAQNTMLGANSNLYVEMFGFTSPIVYTTGANAVYILTSDTPTPTASTIKYWDGSSWANGVVKYYNGSTWANGVAKIWNGTKWVDTQ